MYFNNKMVCLALRMMPSEINENQNVYFGLEDSPEWAKLIIKLFQTVLHALTSKFNHIGKESRNNDKSRREQKKAPILLLAILGGGSTSSPTFIYFYSLQPSYD
jgi:hypothetical protein